MVAVLTINRATSLQIDGGDAGVVDSGDTLRTRVTITNTGDADATNTTFHDSFFGSTLTGSINISPIAFNDSFTAVGNTVLRVGGAANIGSGPSFQVTGNLLDNDAGSATEGTGVVTGDGVTGFQIVAVTNGTSAGGGVFNVFSDGSFNYVSQAGDTGSDSFTYTITDAGLDGDYSTTADNLTSTATVKITLSGQVWYVDSSASAGGTGTSVNPFNSITALNTANVDGADDYVYVKGSASGAITLESGEHLIGEGSSLDVNSYHLADAGSRSSISSSSGYTVTLGGGGTGNNEIAGIDIASTAAASGTSGGISGSSFGTLTVSNATIDATSQGLILSTGAISGTGFGSVNSDGGANNVSLTSVTGSLNLGGGALSGATGNAFFVSGGNGSVDYDGSISHTGNAAALVVTAKTGGTAQFDGAISSTGSSDGVSLTNNTGATINFTNMLTLDTDASSGSTSFNATGGGTVNATGSGSTISAAGAAGVNIQNTTIGASGVTFQSVSANGGANGIVLNNTGSTGGLTITGTGSNGTGGTIQNATGDGISLTNTTNFHASWMTIQNNDGNGIGGSTVNGMVLDHLTISGNGDSAADDDSGIDLTQLTGSASNGANPTAITNTTFTNNYEFEVQITNTSGTLTNFQFLNNTVTSDGADVIGNLVNFLGSSSATMGITATGNTFTGNAPNTATALHLDTSGTALTAIVQNNSFVSNNVGVNVSTGPGSSTLSYLIDSNTFTNQRSTAINEFHNGNSPYNRTVNGTISNNTIGTNGVANSGSSVGAGISISNEGAVSAKHLISGNTIQSIGTFGSAGGSGISVNMGLGGLATGGGTENLTITNNVIRDIMNSRAVVVQDNQVTNIASPPGAGPFPTINLSMAGNQFLGTIAGQAGNGQYMRLKESYGTFNVTQLAATGGTGATELDNANGFNDPTKISTSSTNGSGLTYGAAAPTLPTSPSLPILADAPPTKPAAPLAGDTTGQDSGGQADGSADGQPAVTDDGVLNQGELQLVVDAAIARWEAAGASAEQVAAMREVAVTVSDIGGLTLGESQAGAIVVDDNAAGWSWFVDATPGDDAEFSGTGTVLEARDALSQAGTRMDLLTVIMHELGHQIGLSDGFAPGTADDLMYGTISAGERRLPDAQDVASASGEAVTGAFAISPINLGTLQPGHTVTIEWDHTVDAPAEDGLTGAGGQAFVDSDQTSEIASTLEAVAVDGLTLGDTVFYDVNRDGVFDSGPESGIAGVTLTLYADTNDNGTYDAGTDKYVGFTDNNANGTYEQGIDTPAAAGTGTALTATTDATGYYQFDHLAPGDYMVVVDAANFSSGNALEGKVVNDGAGDPDDDVDNDNNGALVGGTTVTGAIRLDYGAEPDGADNDDNGTLDIGFVIPNQAPTSTGLASDSVTWTEGDTFVQLDAGGDATISDTDSADFDGGSLTIEITSGAVLAEDLFAVRDEGTGAGQIGSGAGGVTYEGVTFATVSAGVGGSGGLQATFTFNANATQAAVQALLHNILYSNQSTDNPTDGDRTITWTLVDGDGTAAGGDDTLTLTSTVDVDPVDDAPVAQADAVTTPEDTVGSGNVFADNGSGADSDVDSATMTVSEVNGASGDVGMQVTLGSGALLTQEADGDYAYDPNGKFDYLVSASKAAATGAVNTIASDSWDYTLTGGNSVTVSMTVTGVDGTGDELWGDGSDNTLTGTTDADFFRLTQGGEDTANGGTGDDAFYMGAAMSAGDALTGGGGALDQLGLQGNYGAVGTPFTFGAASFTDMDMLVLLSGGDARFGDTAGNLYDYYLKTDDGNVAAGERLLVTWNTLVAGEDVSFDGSAETDGKFLTFAGAGVDTIKGGQQDDGFYFGYGNWGASDSVDGQGGTLDQLGLQGLYTSAGSGAIAFGAGQLAGIEMIVCLTGGDVRFGAPAGSGYSYDLTMDDGNVGLNETLTISANTLRAAGGALASDETLMFNGANESNGKFVVYSGAGADTIIGGAGDDALYGGGGADQLTGNAGDDLFAYTSAAYSTASATDHILDFAAGDRIALDAIDAVAGGADNAFAFIGDAAFSGAAGELRAYETTPGSGTWVVEADVDGGGADLVIDVTVTDAHSLTSADFIL